MAQTHARLCGVGSVEPGRGVIPTWRPRVGTIPHRGTTRRVTVVVSANSRGGQNPLGDSSDDVRFRKRPEGLRYEWKWHEARSRPGSWNKGCASDRPQQSSVHDSSEVWDCYNGSSVPPRDSRPQKQTPTNKTPKEPSPEKEFTSLASKLPSRARMGVDLVRNGRRYLNLPQVYVILFGVKKSATEGIYSLRSYNGMTGLHVETIICFECNEEAFRFAGLLEATMQHAPTVHTIQPKDLLRFCKESGYSCRLEPKGSMFMPPEFNVGITDWERSMRLREGKYEVLKEEPHAKKKSELPPFSGNPEDLPKHIQEINDSITMELDEYRAMLERMLPKDEP